jgi:hypothetical protein
VDTLTENPTENPLSKYVNFLFILQNDKDPEKLRNEFMLIISNLKIYIMEKYGFDEDTTEKLIEASMDFLMSLRKEIYKK